MTAPYQIKNTAGSVISTVYPAESNGVANKSLPHLISDVIYSNTMFSPAVDTFVLAGDVTTRFVEGFQFNVADSGYAGIYTVSLTGSQPGAVVAIYANGNTYVPISTGIGSPSFSIVGVEPGSNGRFHLEGVINGHYTFLPTQAFNVVNNSLPAANTSYTVQSAETSGTYRVLAVNTTTQQITIAGDEVRFFDPGTQFFMRGSLGGSADKTYTVLTSATNGSGDTVITVSSAVAIPTNTAVDAQMVVSRVSALTLVTVAQTIPLGTGANGSIVLATLTSLAFVAPTTISATANPQVSTVVFNVASDYTSVLLQGAPILIRQALVSGVRTNFQTHVISTAFIAPTQAYPSGVTQVTTSYTNAAPSLPQLITDGNSTLVFPALSLLYGWITYTVPFVDTPVALIGRGASTFNDTTTWGQALQENIVHSVENFANTTPPASPLTGMLWYDTATPALRLKTSGTYGVVGVVTGNQGTQSWSIDGNAVATTGDKIVIYDNIGYQSAATVFTVASASTSTTPSTSTGYTTTVVVNEAIVIGASTALPTTVFPYGKMYNLTTMNGVIVSGVPAIGNVDMGGHSITNTANPTNAQDVVTKSFADATYVNVTGDTMTGALTMQGVNVEMNGGNVHLTGSSAVSFDPTGSGGVSVQGSGSVYVASGTVTLGTNSTNQVVVANNGTAAPTITFSTSSATSPTGNAVINLGSNKITNSSTPTSSTDVATKQYVDDRVNGIMWLTPVLDPNLFDDSLSAPPVVAAGENIITYHHTYIVKAPGTGAWAGLDGQAVYYNGSTWVSVYGRAVQVGDRFGVFMEPSESDTFASMPAGGLLGQAGKIATVTGISPLTYSFYTPAEPDAVSVKPLSTGMSPHAGHSYTFRGTWGSGSYGTGYSWIEFSGPQMIVDGAGLRYTGNILNVGQGTGVIVGADTISVDTTYTDGRYLLLTGGTLTGQLAMSNYTITGVGDAINPQDAMNQRASDARYLQLAGGTMTGSLLLAGDPSVNLQAATKQYVDTNLATVSAAKVSKAGDTMTGLLVLSGDPVAALGAATKQYVDTKYLALAGGTMTGTLTLAADPTLNLQAATKQYVDNNIATTVSKTTSTTMSAGVNVVFAGGGEVQGLPATPSLSTSATSKSYVDTQVATKATDSLVVHLAGTETITGAKTFNNSVTIAANGSANNLLVTSTNFTVSGAIASSGAAYAIAMTAGQNNGGVGGTITLTGGQGSTTGGVLSLNGGNGTTTGGNVTISSGTGATTTQNGSVTITAGNASLTLDPRGVWYANGLAPTATRQAIVSDPSAPTTAAPKWTSIATRTAAAPVNSAAAGAAGDWFSDDSFFYVYGATGWRRVALSTF